VARNNGHKPLTELAMYRIASVTRAHYWYNHYKVNNGLDCQHLRQWLTLPVQKLLLILAYLRFSPLSPPNK